MMRVAKMKMKPAERQRLADIFHEELDAAHRRITERLSQFEEQSIPSTGDAFDGIRRFYQDLSDNAWSPADEEALVALGIAAEDDIKRIMREGFRRLKVHPVPSFASLVIALRKNPGEPVWEEVPALANRDAFPSADRERIANVLHRELDEAARMITTRLKLADGKFETVREQLETVEGAIISEFTPLV